MVRPQGTRAQYKDIKELSRCLKQLLNRPATHPLPKRTIASRHAASRAASSEDQPEVSDTSCATASRRANAPAWSASGRAWGAAATTRAKSAAKARSMPLTAPWAAGPGLGLGALASAAVAGGGAPGDELTESASRSPASTAASARAGVEQRWKRARAAAARSFGGEKLTCRRTRRWRRSCCGFDGAQRTAQRHA